ncbi:MAG: LTA synthase family protein [Erysipelotrichaceae bacterium]|nr:LTA synthase family protein [Erysipelotrichaceae bacterium]
MVNEQSWLFKPSINSIRGIKGLIIGLLVFSICMMTNQAMTGVICGAIIILSSFLTIKVSKKRVYEIFHVLYLIAMAITICLCSQYFLEVNDVFNIGAFGILMNVVVISMVFFVFYVISNRFQISLLLTSLSTLSLCIVNYFIYIFRGNELMPLDFLSVGTAMNVIDGYKLSMTPKMAYGLAICTTVYIVGQLLTPETKQRQSHRLSSLCVLIALFVAWMIGGSQLTMRTWQNMGTKQNGYLMNFTLMLKSEMMTGRPGGYSLRKVKELEKQYPAVAASDEELPDVIAIMNESFADLNVLGDLHTDTEVMPFFHSLKKNTIKGYALASVFGGGTANSEFEFLTGHSVANLPMGATAYQLYVNHQTHSIANDLKHYGYTCTATHPYIASGWSRNKVYPLLGFDDYTFISDYPRKDLVRGFVSDWEMYNYMIKRYEQKGDQRLFSFGVTIQNHGGYTYQGTNFTPSVALKGYTKDYPDVEQYLGLMRESDDAFSYLINYFKQVDHKVIVVMFGDHQPRLDSDFYQELHGHDFSGPDEELQYLVPFVVWANYDIEEKEVELTSINYLSNYIYEAMGVEKPSYNKFLTDLSKAIPSMNAYSYYSKSQDSFVSFEEAQDEERKWLIKYKILQYNGLFDDKHRSKIIFPIP